jgi:hypothetical protein
MPDATPIHGTEQLVLTLRLHWVRFIVPGLVCLLLTAIGLLLIVLSAFLTTLPPVAIIL